jgi:hypothetical protein
MAEPITVNEYDLALARSQWAEQMLGVLDAKRPTAWSQYGYREVLYFQDYLNAYERGGVGNGAVHRILDRCWQDWPRIKDPTKDAETPFETAIKDALEAIGGWPKLADFDRRNMVGRFAGLIYRVADNQPLSQPLKFGKLVDLVPVYENQIRVTLWETDPESPDYGKPLMWQYRMRLAQHGDTMGAPDQWMEVHPSRIQILAEGAVGDFLDGVPLLKAGFNSLVDLEKISGGSGESFLKNSARQLQVKFDKDASLQALKTNPDGTQSTDDVRTIVQDRVRALNRNIDSAIVLQGGEASTLQTQQIDPEPPFHVAANIFAASVRIPFTILFGQQTGRLASDQDQKDFNARCESRRRNLLTPMLREFVTRMQAIGAFPAGKFEIEWSALDSPGDAEKVDQLGKMTAAMQQAFQAGLARPLFDENELRAVVDYEERPDAPMLDDTAAYPAAAPAPATKPIPIGMRAPRAAP